MPLKALGSLHLPLTYILLNHHDMKRSLQPDTFPCAGTTAPKAMGLNNHGPKPSKNHPFVVCWLCSTTLLPWGKGNSEHIDKLLEKAAGGNFCFILFFAVLWIKSRALSKYWAVQPDYIQHTNRRVYVVYIRNGVLEALGVPHMLGKWLEDLNNYPWLSDKR